MTTTRTNAQEIARKSYRLAWHSLRVLESGNLPAGTTERDFTLPVEYARKWYPGMVEHLEALVSDRAAKRADDASWYAMDDTLRRIGYYAMS